MKRPSPTTLKKKADVLFSQLVRARGECQSCGERDKLQCAHIVSRRYAATRCDLGNALCLCAGCHMHFTHWPVEFARFVEDTIGEYEYDCLKAKAQLGPQAGSALAFWQAEYDRLKEYQKQTGAV